MSTTPKLLSLTITTVGLAAFDAPVHEPIEVNDEVRRLLLPPLPEGFRRGQVRFTAIPSLNTLSFDVTDEFESQVTAAQSQTA